MKLEEAIAKAKILNDSLKELTDEYEGQGSFIAAGMAVSFKLVLDTILTALRPVSKEQVEKVWRGCECCSGSYTRQKLGYQYCENCGAPLTDEAVDIRLKELEALYGDR